jgi:hypothetical protein
MRESRKETSLEMLLVNGLSKVTDNAILQRAGSDFIIRVGCHQNCRNRMARIYKVPVELNAGHRWHVDIRDKAGRLAQARGREEISRRREYLDSMAQRSHEPSH